MVEWGSEIKAAANVVWDFVEGVVAGLGDQVSVLWNLLTNPGVLKDLAEAFITDPQGTIEAIVKDLGEDVQKVISCGPADIGRIAGQNINPLVAARIVGKLGRISGNTRLTRYADELEQNIDCASFPAGTLITTPGGQTAIENIVKGSEVSSRDEQLLHNSAQKVIALHSRQADGYQRIQTESGVIEATAEHPFWVQGRGWVEARDLKWEDPIATANGDVVAYQNEYIEKPIKVYNFTVDNTASYFAGAMGAWVHNANCNLPTRQSPSGYRIGESDGGPGSWSEINRPDTDAYRYQEQVTGAPRSVEYKVNGVDFDGYDAERGVLLDAKNYGNNNPLVDGAPKPVTDGFLYGRGGTLQNPNGGMIGEAIRQVDAARGAPIEWNVATPEAAQAVRAELDRAIAAGVLQPGIVVTVVPNS